MQPFDLKDGIKIGGKTQMDVELRELTAADIFSAQEAAERVVMVPGSSGSLEPQMVCSPSQMGREILRRQIVRIGEVHAAQIDDEFIGRLTANDLAIIEHHSSLLEEAASNALKRMLERGRDESASANGGEASASN